MRLAAAALLLVAACRGGGGAEQDERAERERALPPVTEEWVVVRADAWLYLQPGERGARVHAVPQRRHAGDARAFRLVARRDDGWVEVENAPARADGSADDGAPAWCYPGLGLEDYQLRFFVNAGDLLRVTSAPALHELPEDREVALAPGAAVVDGRVELPVASVVLPRAPGGLADAYRPGPIPPGRPEEPLTSTEEARRDLHPWEFLGSVYEGTHDLGGGVEVGLRFTTSAPRGRGGVVVEEGCARIRMPGGRWDRSVDPQLARQMARSAARRNRVLGEADRAGAIAVPAGSVVRLEDGTRIGQTRTRVVVEARCAEIEVEAGRLVVCHDVAP